MGWRPESPSWKPSYAFDYEGDTEMDRNNDYEITDIYDRDDIDWSAYSGRS